MTDEQPEMFDITEELQAQVKQQAQATVFARDVLAWLTRNPDIVQRFWENLCVEAGAGWALRGKKAPTLELTQSNLEFTYEVLNQITGSLFDMGVLEAPEPPNDPSLS